MGAERDTSAAASPGTPMTDASMCEPCGHPRREHTGPDDGDPNPGGCCHVVEGGNYCPCKLEYAPATTFAPVCTEPGHHHRTWDESRACVPPTDVTEEPVVDMMAALRAALPKETSK